MKLHELIKILADIYYDGPGWAINTLLMLFVSVALADAKSTGKAVILLVVFMVFAVIIPWVFFRARHP